MFKDYFFVGVQALLFLAIFFDLFEYSLGFGNQVVGLVLISFGGVLIVVSIFQLNKNLSPFPSPVSEGKLVTNGIYSVVRHPIYLGIIISLLGYSVISNSLYKLVVVVLVTILFHFKANYEESLLIKKFSSYHSYKERTSKIFPIKLFQ